MSFTFRPATREDTPLIVGIAGPTKSGKTMSALRLAAGMTTDVSRIAMLNAEGKRGKQYADWFEAKYGKKYLECSIGPPYSPERYTEALLEMKKLGPTVGIIDSASHMHDGPGGLLEYHDAEVLRLGGDDTKKQERVSMGSAWIKPKAAENKFIYAMLDMECPIILCFRAKEKIKIITGRPPVDLGWQPIAGDRITFETIFTLMIPSFCKGVPDRELSEMRDPFDKMVPFDKAVDEALGRQLATWARGGATTQTTTGITREQAIDFTEKFNAALTEKLKPQAKTILSGWLKKQGMDGLSALKSEDFTDTRDAAVQYAKEQV